MFVRIAIVLLSTLTSAAFADTVDKSMDGKTAYCLTTADAGKTSYRPSSFDVGTQGANVTLNFSVNALVCQQLGSALTWVPRVFTDSYQTVDRDGQPVTVTLKNLQFVVVNQDFDTLGVTPAPSATTQALDYKFAIQSLLNSADLNALETGKTLDMRWEFFMNGVESVTSANGNVTPIGQVSGGAYEILFKLSKVHGGYVVQ